jgi:hypothetical protein
VLPIIERLPELFTADREHPGSIKPDKKEAKAVASRHQSGDNWNYFGVCYADQGFEKILDHESHMGGH